LSSAKYFRATAWIWAAVILRSRDKIRDLVVERPRGLGLAVGLREAFAVSMSNA